MKRRDFVKYTAAGLLAGSTLVSARVTGGVRQLRLALRPEQRHWFAPVAAPLELWGSDRELLRLQQHESVEIEVVNQLPDATSLHWHGMRLDNAMDGVSGITQAPIPPGGRFVYRLTPPDAGTFWVHAHHKSYEQLARGLYLPLIVEEASGYRLDREQLLVLDDWRLGRDRQLDIASLGDLHDWAHGGRMGNIITVNRQLRPPLAARAGERLRLRVLNAANARIMVLELPPMPAWILAKDGQPLTSPLRLEQPLVLAPAERYDLVVDIPDGWEGEYPLQYRDRDKSIVVARLVVKGRIERSLEGTPAALPANPLPALPDRAPDHRVQLDMAGGAMGSLREARYEGRKMSSDQLIRQRQVWAFNGVANLPDAPLVSARPGDLIEIELLNNTRWPHGLHLHGHHFQTDLPRYAPGLWHDTLLMAAGEKAAIRFQAGAEGRWLLHCHMIEHQAAGMATWIDVRARRTGLEGARTR